MEAEIFKRCLRQAVCSGVRLTNSVGASKCGQRSLRTRRGEKRSDLELMNSLRHGLVCLLSYASHPAAVCRRQQLPATAQFVRLFDVIHGG